MDETTSRLIEAATAVCGEFRLGKDFSAGSVGAALLTADGHIYTGICIDLACGLGFCAEVAAMAEMLKHRETQIEAIVAVCEDRILPPCGRCRETMVQIDPCNCDSRVILGEDHAVPLSGLVPCHWLGAWDEGA
ncbi:MAG: cytidine deaminase [Anaerolineae bacterium]|nr:cytidine deaminase [Anaerolineae bacterium]